MNGVLLQSERRGYIIRYTVYFPSWGLHWEVGVVALLVGASPVEANTDGGRGIAVKAGYPHRQDLHVIPLEENIYGLPYAA